MIEQYAEKDKRIILKLKIKGAGPIIFSEDFFIILSVFFKKS